MARLQQLRPETQLMNCLRIPAVGVRALAQEGQTSVGSLYCGFRGKVGGIPTSSRSAFRNESGHDSGIKLGRDSDFKPVILGFRSEP